MRGGEADAERQRLQRDDRQHTYLVHERSGGEWDVVRVDIPHSATDVVAERGEPTDVPEDPRPFITRQVPPYGPPGFG